MGNNASHSGNISQRQQIEQEQQWAHSFPRTPQRTNQHNKVLPDVTGDVHQKLRPTNNGEILYNGGTISGRHHSSLSLPRDDVQHGVYRSNSISSKHAQDYMQSQDNLQQRHFLPHQRESLERLSPRRSHKIPADLRHPHGHQSHQRELQMKRFGSVPDLRGQDAVDHPHMESRDHANRGRKKYKAPPPPSGNNMAASNGSSLDSWEMNCEAADAPVRRTRLFKTRAEMKKRAPSPQNHRRSMDSHPKNNTAENKRFRSKSKEPQSKLTETKAAETAKNDRNRRSDPNYRIPLSEMQRSKSLPEFQAELREATQRLRSTKLNQTRQDDRNSMPNDSYSSEQKNKNNAQRYSMQDTKENKLKTLDPNVVKKEHIKYKMRQMEKTHSKDTNQETDTSKSSYTKRSSQIEAPRGRASGKESTPEYSPAQKSREKSEPREQPSKTFYFGMDETAQPNSFNSNLVDNFALSLQKHNCIIPTQAYSGSDLSSELDIDDSQISTNGIALHLRPILPKKQLEIPRFSPAAAWRLLSAFDSNPPPSTVSDEGPVLMEDRIEKLSRQPPSLSIPGVGPRSSHDKSGDSGISGDAGPPGFEDNSDPILPNSRNNNIPISASNCPLNLSWTPQQDLEGEEESSSEGGLNNRNIHIPSTSVKFSPRSQVFSLSLPRDNHLAAYMEEKARQHSPPSYTNLQRLKRSVSGVLGNFSGKIKDTQPSMTQDQDDNWFLSRSAPNSLNNGFNSLEIRLSKHNNNILTDLTDDRTASLVPIKAKNPTNSNGGRVMYLPECKDNEKYDSYKKDTSETQQYKSQSKKDKYKSTQNGIDSNNDLDINKNNFRLSAMSKSCENISSGTHINKSPFEPEDLQDPPQLEVEKWKGRKPKRFTFQSTVRQIERRRLAEKLSREAERKEQQRLSELEAMRRVEEEFQRKRAKEKASIRQQLRLFSMDDTVWTSLPPNWDKEDVPARSEPDGAVSSSASSPTHDSPTKLMDMKHIPTHNDVIFEPKKKPPLRKNSAENKSSPTFKKFLSRQGSESSDDTRVKAQATQVLSEYRQPRREYKDYRGSSRCVAEGTDNTFHNDSKQTTVHPQVICNMPKAHQGSSTDGSSRSNNYRRDFAHGIMLPGKPNETFPEDTQSNIRKHSPRIPQNQRTRQGKCIS